MTNTDLVRRVIGRLVHDGFEASGLYEPDIFSQVRPSLIDLGVEMASGPLEESIIYRKAFSITLGSNNTVSLATQLTAASQPMIIRLPFPMVRYTGSTTTINSELGWVADPAVASLIDVADDIAFYSMEDVNFIVYNQGIIPGDTVSITANFIPDIADIKRSFESRLVDKVVEKFKMAVGAQQSPKQNRVPSQQQGTE